MFGWSPQSVVDFGLDRLSSGLHSCVLSAANPTGLEPNCARDTQAEQDNLSPLQADAKQLNAAAMHMKPQS